MTQECIVILFEMNSSSYVLRVHGHRDYNSSRLTCIVSLHTFVVSPVVLLIGAEKKTLLATPLFTIMLSPICNANFDGYCAS